MKMHIGIFQLVIVIGLLLSGCNKRTLSDCPRSLAETPMPDLPTAAGFYQGKISVTFVIHKTGRISDVTVDASELRLDGNSVNNQTVEAYAIESLQARQFSARPEPCKVTFSAWVN